ncbi:hypothetical protein ALC57_04526 [Trachymyrmex cornetzi]|uniref:Uncharacterized protein n=1 Tax=Trachymyrmex cornetzi TaxID=471704 RepID=A0A195ED47_9HYME|nr:hypothetical protein ALC57_04526 [Trachymyrmex cornetzi]
MTQDQRLLIVIAAPASTGTTFQATLSTNFFTALAEYYALEDNFVSHHLSSTYAIHEITIICKVQCLQSINY